MLAGKKILLFVSGSIAVYKSLLLIRLLRKEGANVRVVASESALKFIGEISFEALSGQVVLCAKNESWLENAPNHISYARWADIAIFAPLSVNSLNKLASGIADNVYLSCAIALRKIPKLLALSANTFMIENEITKKSIESLKNLGYEIIDSVDGELACGESGNGAMASVEEIVFRIKRALHKEKRFCGKNIIVTGGGSSESIDSVRCISNYSSGLQASNLALALFYKGANVVFISSKFPLQMPSNIRKIAVTSSREYLDSILSFKDCEYLFMVAAISDYIPLKSEGKLKKSEIGERWHLELHENIDILKSINDIKKIAFKAECDSKAAFDNARNLLESKGCMAVCLNIIDSNNKAFGEENNILHVLQKDSHTRLEGSKFEVSMRVCDILIP